MRKAGIALFALAVALGGCVSRTGDNGGANADGKAPTTMANVAELARSIGDQAVEKTSVHMEITADVDGQQMMAGEGDFSFAAGDEALSMDVDVAGSAMSAVYVDGAVYMKMPEGQELEPGKPWFKMDASVDSPAAGLLGNWAEQLSKSANPRKALEQFEEIGEITDTREEQPNGEPTTHYTITVDAKELAAETDDPTQKEAIEESGIEEFTVDVWINEEDLPSRILTEMAGSDGQGGTAPVTTRVDYTDWGKPVDISAPPADQVVEFP